MTHDHSNCERQHHRDWNESPVMAKLDVIATIVRMAQRGETDEVTAVNTIYGTLDSINEPWVPIQLENLFKEVDFELHERILALPEEVVETYRIKLATNLPASEIAKRLDLEEWKIWLHLDAVEDAIHDH